MLLLYCLPEYACWLEMPAVPVLRFRPQASIVAGYNS